MTKNVKQGWQCPECKTIYAPTVEKCECVKVPVQKYVYPYYPYWPYPYQTYPYWPYWGSGSLTVGVSSATSVATLPSTGTAWLDSGSVQFTPTS